MKLLAFALVTAAALCSGACTPSVTDGAPLAGPTAQASSSGGSSAGSRRDSVASMADSDREPAGSMRAERGIPTPQPARDPAVMAIPVPQPPLPGPEPHHSGNARGYESRR
ncbi:MAG: hypothetical protein WCJ30_25120 [Deltaproteobacteria bacterium]